MKSVHQSQTLGRQGPITLVCAFSAGGAGRTPPPSPASGRAPFLSLLYVRAQGGSFLTDPGESVPIRDAPGQPPRDARRVQAPRRGQEQEPRCVHGDPRKGPPASAGSQCTRSFRTKGPCWQCVGALPAGVMRTQTCPWRLESHFSKPESGSGVCSNCRSEVLTHLLRSTLTPALLVLLPSLVCPRAGRASRRQRRFEP